MPVAAPASSFVAPVAAVSRDGLMVLLLDVVSEKTGYPADMLNMEMELEADLGIDSIKRVEILSAMQDEVPELPEVDTAVMAELVTLGQIVDYMDSQIAAVEAAPASSLVVPAAAVSRDGLMVLLLDVVSEKTGYPADMLNMEMELEADLGIDSIKRVEILSAMQDEVPELPEVDTAVMAELVTLGQIVDYMDSQIDGASAPNESSPIDLVETGRNSEIGTTANGSVPTAAGLGRYITESVAAPATGSPMVGLADGKIVVTNDGGSVGSTLVELLLAAGMSAELVDQVPASGYSGAILLGGLRDVSTEDEAIAVNREAFAAARAVAGSVVSGGVFVTVADNSGSFGPWNAGLTGLARTAAIEWPTTTIKAIDIESAGRDAGTIASAIATELLAGGPELEVGLVADGTRTVLRSTLVAVESGSMPLSKDDVIVVSGGGRGVTAATMIELAKDSGASFALLGRSVLEDEPAAAAGAPDDAALKRALLDAAVTAGEAVSPADLGRQVSRILANREILATIAAIEQHGGRAAYLSVDITDAEAVTSALAGVRSDLGAITGIVHGAGVLADKLIAEKTDAQFDRVFDTKVEGLRTLLTATADDALKLLLFFSSVAARTGNNGSPTTPWPMRS